MSLILRLTTLFIIAAAGFALPMTCAQSGAAAAERTAIEIPVSPHLESPARALADHLGGHVVLRAARDEIDEIARGTHQRAVVMEEKFKVALAGHPISPVVAAMV